MHYPLFITYIFKVTDFIMFLTVFYLQSILPTDVGFFVQLSSNLESYLVLILVIFASHRGVGHYF